MKTPREILLEQHRSANARLDALRAAALAGALPSQKSATAPERISVWHIFQKLWRELLWPCRHAWTGMAALWLALWVINSGISSDLRREAPDVRHLAASSLVQTIQEQRRLMTELVPPSDSQPVEPPRSNLRPRSQRASHVFKI